MYDQAVDITNRKDVGNIDGRMYHPIMGGFNSKVFIDGKRMYEDVWDFALNQKDKVNRKKLLSDLWRHTKSGARSDNFNKWIPANSPGADLLTVGERVNEIKGILPKLASLEARNLIGLITHPTTVRGVLRDKDLHRIV